jgi:hypothetical protein
MHPSRRQALGLGAAAACTATIPRSPPSTAFGPDAKLIAQCGETTRLRGMMNAVVDAMMGLSFEKAEEFQPDLDRTTTAYCEAVELVATIPAVSPAGVRAKATCLRDSIEEEIGIAGGECMGDRQHVLAWSLLRDMATVPG